ncbi:MAG: alpha-amylase family glycosyl hydrolase [Verrucomicrobiota bacterium]
MKWVRLNHMRRIRQRFVRLYGDGEELMERVYMMLGRYGVGREPVVPDDRWNENDVVLITYADMVEEPDTAPLATLRKFSEVHLLGAFRLIHILPFSPWSSDDGFSVIDYLQVKEEYGAWDDIESLRTNFQLMMDLVLNHCSSESSWFRDYVNGVQPGCDFFLEEDPATDLSAVVRPRTSPILTKTSTRSGEAHIWTTFSADQVDLNWKNPDVFFAFLDALFLYISHGARIIRLDAVAFLWKEVGTDCLHRPETHDIVQQLRDILSIAAPEVIVLTETNVPHEENISYFGRGNEAHMVYQFALPPLLLYSLLKEDSAALRQWASTLIHPPRGCTFFNFTASHDGIGVRPLDGILDTAERDWLIDQVIQRGGRISSKEDSDGSHSPYEMNITYRDALSDPEWGIERFLCSQALMLALRGMPAVYFHSLVGTPNDLGGVEEKGYARAINRKKWKLEDLEKVVNDLESDEGRIFNAYQSMLRRRANHPAFHPEASQKILDWGHALFVIRRRSRDGNESILCLFNFTRNLQPLSTEQIHADLGTDPATTEKLRNILTGLYVDIKTGLTLNPFEAIWLTPGHGPEAQG